MSDPQSTVGTGVGVVGTGDTGVVDAGAGVVGTKVGVVGTGVDDCVNEAKTYTRLIYFNAIL